MVSAPVGMVSGFFCQPVDGTVLTAASLVSR